MRVIEWACTTHQLDIPPTEHKVIYDVIRFRVNSIVYYWKTLFVTHDTNYSLRWQHESKRVGRKWESTKSRCNPRIRMQGRVGAMKIIKNLIQNSQSLVRRRLPTPSMRHSINRSADVICTAKEYERIADRSNLSNCQNAFITENYVCVCNICQNHWHTQNSKVRFWNTSLFKLNCVLPFIFNTLITIYTV